MTREEFFRRLNDAMRNFPQAEIARANEYYEEYWRDAADSGLSDEQISAGLDRPEDIAARIRAECAFDMAVQKPTAKNTGNGCLILLVAVLAAPVALPLAISVLAVVFSLLVTVFALALSLSAVVLAMFFTALGLLLGGLSAVWAAPVVGLPLLGASLLLAGLSLLAGLGCAALIKALFRACAMFFRWLFGRFSRRRRGAGTGGEVI